MATIKADCAKVITELEAQFTSEFPNGSASEAETVSEVDAHISRLEHWRRLSLDADPQRGEHPTRFESERKRIAKAVDAFDAETERLRRQGLLTPEESQTRQRDFLDGQTLTNSTGTLLNFYRRWVMQLRAAVADWKQRRKELESRT